MEVIDPTLFHGREAYEGLCLGTPRSGEGFLLCYILDASQEKEEFINKVANQRGLSVRLFRAGKHAELSVEEWIAMYRDAECVVTDSFHGTVFSILFHKPFFSIANENRGAERFRSLLVKFGLENRLLNHLHMVDFSEEIDWVHVDVRLDALRKEAVGFLNASLN